MPGIRRSVVKAVVISCIASLTALISAAQANPWGGGGEQCGKHQRQHFKELENKLGLSDTQKAQAKTIFQGNKAMVQPLFASLQTERRILQVLIHADVIDEAAIRAQTAKISGIQADLNVNRAKVDAQFRAILTPAQITILKTLPQKGPKNGNPPPVPE